MGSGEVGDYQAMRQRFGNARKRVWGRLLLIGAGAIAGLLAGGGQGKAQNRDLSPAQVVAFRFPAAWHGALAPAPGAAPVIKQQHLFDPNPTYALASADSQPAQAATVLAYADTSVAASSTAEPMPTQRPVERRVRPAKPNNHILNDAQIASIKARLKLTPDQQRYWPAVEAALRGIAYKINKGKGSIASIDAESPEVAQLKSAAIPLIMMFSEEQKSEVRQLAQVMGLQKLASQF